MDYIEVKAISKIRGGVMIDDLQSFKFKEVATIWTGDAEGKNTNEEQNTNEEPNAFLRETGILGSIRWWYEAVVRGYRGYACDPTSDFRCPDKNGNRCAVCDFFGCTNWSAKFRFRVEKQNKTIIMNFIPIKEIKNEEIILLIKTFNIISEYGCIGGKTTLKPPMPNEMNDDKKFYHKDFGIIEWKSENKRQIKLPEISIEDIENYVKKFKVYDDKGNERQNDKEFPNLYFFIFKKGEFLDQDKMTQLLNQSPNWLKGKIGKSKFLFSFWTSRAERWWCYSKADENEYIKLKELLNKNGLNDNLIEGRELLKKDC